MAREWVGEMAISWRVGWMFCGRERCLVKGKVGADSTTGTTKADEKEHNSGSLRNA